MARTAIDRLAAQVSVSPPELRSRLGEPRSCGYIAQRQWEGTPRKQLCGTNVKSLKALWEEFLGKAFIHSSYLCNQFQGSGAPAGGKAR